MIRTWIVALTAVAALVAPTTGRGETTVDGFVVEHLPPGTGQQTSTHEFEWEDVTFTSQVWERGPDESGAYAVDVTVKVLRGPALVDLDSTSAFLAGYHEEDAAGWIPFDHDGQAGFQRSGAIFWWVEPGTAVEVSLDVERFGSPELAATALGVRSRAG